MFSEYPQFIKECRTGEVIENDCNKCICSSRKVFECTPKKCNTIELETSCRPDTIYVTDAKTCICNRFGKWPHQDCSNIFQNLPDTDRCEPNTYVTVDCNVCRCGADGKIDEDHCTKNPCQEIKKADRRHLGTGQVDGACDVSNWYSLAPCQFCYCINENKLVCNTGNRNSENLELGSYKLNVCGKELLKEAMDLLPQNKNNYALRHGNRVENTTKRTTTTTTSTTNPEIQGIVFENDMNYQTVTLATEINDVSNSESQSSESEEYYRTPQTRLQEHTEKPATVLVVESTENINEEAKTKAKDSDYSNEILVETENVKPKPKVMAINTVMKLELDSIDRFLKPVKTIAHKLSSLKAVESTEAKPKDERVKLPNDLNLPGILNKVFQMALKKSMVSIVADAKCKPGTTSALKCNVCFCTHDSKMICTNTKCH